MSDDWSLKYKKIFGYDSEGKVFSSVLEKGKLQEMYNEDDIETLRQKLIEDMQSILEIERLKYESRTDTVDRCINFVNKRFGVEE